MISDIPSGPARVRKNAGVVFCFVWLVGWLVFPFFFFFFFFGGGGGG